MKTPRERAEELANEFISHQNLDNSLQQSETVDFISKKLEPLLEEIDAARNMRDRMKRSHESFGQLSFLETKHLFDYDAIRKRNEELKLTKK